MTNTKMTKKDWFAELITVVSNSDYANKDAAVAFMEHEIELLSRNKSTKPTATQKENAAIKETIVEVLGTAEKMTVSELMKDSRLADHSNQKLSALLRQLKLEGRVDKEIIKKKAYFFLVE